MFAVGEFTLLLAIFASGIGRRPDLMERPNRFRYAVFVGPTGWNDAQRQGCLEWVPFDGEQSVHRVRLRDDDIVGRRRSPSVARRHRLTTFLDVFHHVRPRRRPRILHWMRFCIASGRREFDRRPEEHFLPLVQGAGERGLPRSVGMMTVAVDFRLVAVALQLLSFLQPLRFPANERRDVMVAPRISFNREALAAILAARGCGAPILAQSAFDAAA